MNYPELEKLFHMDTSSNRASSNRLEFKRRKAMDSTFCVKVFSDSEELFIAVPQEMILLIEKVLCEEKEYSSMMKKIPPIGRAALVRGLVLDEVVSTNAIENINSTRRQIEEALELESINNTEFRRFKELALLYLGLAGDGNVKEISEPKDIRKIYDAIMEGELNESNKPDGELFRKNGVDITANGVKIVHRGVEPESKIIEGLTSMLELVKSKKMPALISAIASHYIFESIHPFYDGNGRTGRYLLALFLKDILSTPTVLSLSRTIAENKSKYYSAFATVEKPLNHGEMTHFVYAILELIRIAQSTTLERMKACVGKYDKVKKNCELFFAQNDLLEKEKEIIFVLAQYSLFGMVGLLMWSDLSNAINLSKQMTRKHLKHLEEEKIIQVVEKRPLKVSLTAEFENILGIR